MNMKPQLTCPAPALTLTASLEDVGAIKQVVPAATNAPAKAAAAADDDLSDSDDDEDLDLFGDLTPEEQAAADEKKKIIEAAKKRGAEKAKLTKSMVVLDVKPWDDTTGATLKPRRCYEWKYSNRTLCQ